MDTIFPPSLFFKRIFLSLLDLLWLKKSCSLNLLSYYSFGQRTGNWTATSQQNFPGLLVYLPFLSFLSWKESQWASKGRTRCCDEKGQGITSKIQDDGQWISWGLHELNWELGGFYDVVNRNRLMGWNGLQRGVSLWLLLWLKTNYALGHLLYTILNMLSLGLHGHRTITLKVPTLPLEHTG